MGEDKVSDEKILKIIKTIANKVKDPEYVKKISCEKSNNIVIDGKSIIAWDDLALADGYPALSVLFGELNNLFPNEDWDLIGHQYMLEIQKSLEERGIDSLSLFGGACGIGMSAYSLSCNGKRYKKFINSINEFIIGYAPTVLRMLTSRQMDVRMNDYDVIQGLAGTGRYLLFFKDDPEIENIIKDILKYMISLTENINLWGHSVPKWYITQQNQFIKSDKEIYSKGSFNFGMSHGITGPLSFMAIALINGIEIYGQKEAMEKIISTLNLFKYNLEGTIYWPGRIKFEEFITKTCSNTRQRASWCYGSPGIARAIFLSGKALNNEEYKNIAIKSLDSLCSLPEEFWFLDSPTFCHGYAGLLRIINCMYIDTGLVNFKKHGDKILNKLLSFYNKDAPFGFFNIDMSDPQKSNTKKTFNTCGLLDGTTGVILTILGIINPNKTNWDSIFLIN
ncbi:hypothetical protein RSJ21_19760 (plasmid) [Clostridium botulinum]|uniref:lanthionine synthetase C family protein n=3 Tax=Clostridium botulinum TaxID=1491 RepID=UPI000A170D69|nr:lanthionine synthetase C family protein [Clostridium botulinum]AUN12748.1 hypothetical protein RSJ6_20090 [Clostridium botulinum]AUN19918.1 hypothetical protein RSJ22_00010 [Clostridium botulinum]AUN27430.1 hypothetical protein RSJ21_19760 [Clostridium botulinum]NFM32724.1 hypothetical protein [Clostridium botulinum]OSA65800.1 hypothetical protein B2H87_19425 [Clostridium botulinum]